MRLVHVVWRHAPKGFKRWFFRRLKDFMYDIYLPAVYREACKQPVDDRKAVFIEADNPVMSNSFHLMWEEMNSTYRYDCTFISLGTHNPGKLRFYRRCASLMRAMATAKYVFLNESSDVVSCMAMRPETCLVQLWHGCGAFKKFGMSTADKKFGASRKEKLRHPYNGNESLVTVSSPEVIWAYVEALGMEGKPEVVQPLGSSRTDIFYDRGYLDCARGKLVDLVPAAKGKKVICYAPTFRGRVATATAPDALDIPAMKDALGSDYVLLVKQHPHVKELPPIPADCEDFAFDVTCTMSIDNLIVVSDICISDYSSLVFEYSLFERPMVFFAYDREDYDDWRGFYYDYDEMTPGPIFTETGQIIDYIQHVDKRFDRQRVIDFRRKFMSACDGSATRRLAEAFLCNELPSRSETMDIASRFRERSPDGVDVSIVIPVYNGGGRIGKAIDSVLAQSYALDRMELVVVDDCSTDGTWDLLQEYARLHPGLVKVSRLESNSGSGAAPRNRGLDMACGEYVFFLDADDWLAPRAVERMLRHAYDWNSDILLVKIIGENGREVGRSMFKGNRSKVDLYDSTLLQTFGPLKLFRRELIERNHLRFPSSMPEDIPFVFRAYLDAQVVSVASDYDYYHCMLYDENEQSSFSTWNDLESNFRTFEDVLHVMEQRVPEERRDEVLLRRFFNRDVYYMALSAEREDEPARSRDLRRIADMFRRYYHEDMYRKLPGERRPVLDALLLGEVPDEASLHIAVQEGIRWVEDEGRITSSAGDVCCDVTAAAKTSCRITDMAGNGEGFLVCAGLKASDEVFRLSGSADIAVVAKNVETKEERLWPCSCEWNPLAGEGLTTGKARVRGHVRLDDLVRSSGSGISEGFGGTTGVTWQLFLRVRIGQWHRDVRVGSDSSAIAKQSFADCCSGYETDLSLRPSMSRKGNFDIVVKAG